MAGEELYQLSQGRTTESRNTPYGADRWDPELRLSGIRQHFVRGGEVLTTVGPLVLPQGVSDQKELLFYGLCVVKGAWTEFLLV